MFIHTLFSYRPVKYIDSRVNLPTGDATGGANSESSEYQDSVIESDQQAYIDT